VEEATYLKAFLTTPIDGTNNRLYPPEKRRLHPVKGSWEGAKAGLDIEMRKYFILLEIKPRFHGRLTRSLIIISTQITTRKQQQQQQNNSNNTILICNNFV
jgi:hypothetical protein